MIDLETLPNPQRRALELVREVAAEKDCRPYLVGGPVRDLLLGREAIDVDLTLEEGASSLARGLAKRVDGRVRSFPQFLTYKVTAAGLPDIDIATARRELFDTIGLLAPAADHVLLHGQTDDLPWYARQLARLPFDFAVIDPPPLREALQALAARLARLAGAAAGARSG